MKFSAFSFLFILGSNVIEGANTVPQRLRGNAVRRSLQVQASSSKDNDRVLTGVRLLQDMSMSSEDSGDVSSASGDSSADSSSED